ncbi:MAG: GNAT family N-acetyltransferase [Verrucomicrobia bacterium]|nr:GNAT family N-acetyltransferase [Verrucomicrobiota bacterium]
MGERVLSRATGTARYRVRLAESEEDLRAAQTLRFLVFNLELNEGLEESFVTCRDADPFDAVCDHLLVEDAASREVVGTYRLQPGPRAAGALGFYCDREFDLAPFAGRRNQLLELGRACVHRDHRNLAVLALLWSGIHRYASQCGARFLMGCSSLPTTDPAMGARAYSDLMRRHLAPEDWRTVPRVDSACPLDRLHPAPVPVPKLLSAYLSLGAWLCGPPALDREFKTVDFLTVLDLATLSPRAAKMLAG